MQVRVLQLLLTTVRFMRRCTERVLLKASAFVCRHEGHQYMLQAYDAGPLGFMVWWYCPRCRWASPPRFLPRFAA